MISAFRVLWKTIKDIWEDMLLLVLMNVLTLLCGLPFLAAVLLPAYLTLTAAPASATTPPIPGQDPLTSLLSALILTLVLAVPTALPFGGALFGLYSVCNRVANGFAISWEIYFTNFKQYFFKSWVYLTFATVIAILIPINFLWYARTFAGQSWVTWVMGAWLAAGMFWVAIQFYVFPFYVEQETKSWRVAFKNAALIAGANPLFTLILLIVTAALLVLSVGLIPPVFVLLGLLIWVMTGTEAVVNRIAAYRTRLEAESKKKAAPRR
jgi:Na+-transporting methylmalonyl-CoA/oxaloacetate decarboxylase gamma subunit